jgi:photosystem II stability/assembly factor-like uncharacterized protein
VLKAKFVPFTLFSCFAFISGAEAQQWQVTHHTSSVVGEGIYQYDAVSCHEEVSMVICEKNVLDSGVHVQVFVFLRSNNGGQSWQEFDPPLLQNYGISAGNYKLNAIQVIDSNNIVVCGSTGVILRTFDGGVTWAKQSISDSSALPDFTCVHFSDPGTGIVSSSGGEAGSPNLYITVDSGNHWTPITLTSDPTLVSAHSYESESFRVTLSSNVIYTTHDNWGTYDSAEVAGPLMLDNLGYSFGLGDTLVAYNLNGSPDPELTTDGGMLWLQPSNLNDSTFDATDMSSLEQNPVFLVGGELDTTRLNNVFVSFDNGATWQTRLIQPANDTPIFWIRHVAVTGSGEAVAIIVAQRGAGQNVEQDYLGYLAPIQASVNAPSPLPSTFAIYPNPATNEIQVTSSEGNISILDPLGRSYEVKQSGNTLDVSSLPSGVYFVSDGVSRAKFVKE